MKRTALCLLPALLMALLPVTGCTGLPERFTVRCAFKNQLAAEQYAMNGINYLTRRAQQDGKAGLLRKYDVFVRVHTYAECGGTPGVAVELQAPEKGRSRTVEIRYLRDLWFDYQSLALGDRAFR